jgi:hypothetical protein
MQKGAIKDLIYGGLEEMLYNSRYYYHSNVGRDYCHLTDEGKVAIVEFMDLMAWKIKQANEEDLERRAKEQVMNALKGKE